MAITDSITSAFYTQIILLSLPLSILALIKLVSYFSIKYEWIKKQASEKKAKVQLTKGPLIERSSDIMVDPENSDFENEIIQIVKRPSNARGKTELDWLTSYHTFSYGKYIDKKFSGYSFLRVLNENVLKPGKGFDPLLRRNFQILTIVTEGVLNYKDSLGNKETIKEREAKLLSCDKVGFQEIEANNFENKTLKYIQFWFEPEDKIPILSNDYQYLDINNILERNKLIQIARPYKSVAKNEGFILNCDVNFYYCLLEPGMITQFDIKYSNRFIYIHHISSEQSNVLHINFEERLKEGDGAFVTTLARKQKISCKNIGTKNLYFVLIDMA